MMKTYITGSLVESAASLLRREEREAVLGDLVEAHESGWRSLTAICGLLLRRQIAAWRTWQPWLAVFGLAIPASFLLMGFSLSVSGSLQQIAGAGFYPDRGASIGFLIGQVLLLAAWSWSGGLVVVSLSRRTLWVSVVSVFSPCLFCLARFRGHSLPRVCLLLFLLPALAGGIQGLRRVRIRRWTAMAFLVLMTVLMVCQLRHGSLLANWLLLWPAWYLVAMAKRQPAVL